MSGTSPARETTDGAHPRFGWLCFCKARVRVVVPAWTPDEWAVTG